MASTAVSTAKDAPAFLDFAPVEPRRYKQGVHVATLQLRSHERDPLDLYSQFALQAAHSLKLPTTAAHTLPMTRELVTVIRSHFVHKKKQENYEKRTYRRAIKVFDADRDTLDLWLRYLKKHSIGGVGLKAYVHEYVEFGFAAGEIAAVEGKLASTSQEKIGKVAAEIVNTLSGVEFSKSAEVKAAADKKKKSPESEKQQPKNAAAEKVKEVKAEAKKVEGEAPAAPAAEKVEAEAKAAPAAEKPAPAAKKPTEPKA
jgi:small subunit ribosomal protein S10